MTYLGWSTRNQEEPVEPWNKEWWVMSGVPALSRMERSFCPPYLDHLYNGANCFHKNG